MQPVTDFSYNQHEKSVTTCIFGGGERDRTDDLLRARQALSQLSYTPWSRILTTVSRNTLNWWA